MHADDGGKYEHCCDGASGEVPRANDAPVERTTHGDVPATYTHQ